MTDELRDELKENVQEDEQTEDAAGDMESADELEQKLLDAMRSLRRKNKMVEEYLDNLAQSSDKPPASTNQPQSEPSSG
jgi:hypothetical protein